MHVVRNDYNDHEVYGLGENDKVYLWQEGEWKPYRHNDATQ